MKKKIILLVTTLVCMLALCSCGKNAEKPDYENDQDLQMACIQMATALQSISADEALYYQAMYSEQEEGAMYADLLGQWAEIQPQVGNAVALKDYKVNVAGKTVSAVQIIEFEKRDVKLTYVINAKSGEPTAINVEMVYTLGETMAKAGLNTLMGIGIVFMILILICLVIYCFNIIPVLEQKLTGKNKSNTKVEIAQPVVREEEPMQDDLELIAVISAAIAAQTGASTDDFVVRSIKRRY